jgi:hypothetical protein
MNSEPQLVDFAGGEEIVLDDIVQKTFSCNYNLRYTTPDGISGKLEFTTKIEENYDNGCCDDWYDDDDGTDTGSGDHDSGTDTDSGDHNSDDKDDLGTDSGSGKKSGSGCSTMVM